MQHTFPFAERYIPQKFCVKDSIESCAHAAKTRTRPEFYEVIQWLDEQENEQYTVTDLMSKMRDLCGDEAYSAVWM
jgi:hypothetical protein